MSDDYKVGYKRPPLEHRFKKGAPSRNPKGRRRGSRNPNLRKVLMEPIKMRIGNRIKAVPFPEALVQSLKEKSLKGEFRAVRSLIDFFRELKMFEQGLLDEDEPFEFTLRIGDTETTFVNGEEVEKKKKK